MNPPAILPTTLRQEIDACGYFPDFVAESVAMALGDEPVQAHLVHHEATFAHDEIHRHLTVLVATPTRLLVTHTDDGPNADALGQPVPSDQAVTSSEAMPLSSVTSVALSRVVASPQSQPAAKLVESWLTIAWGTMRRLDLEPAACADPACDADHGYSGTLVGDDITIRMSEAADGADSVRRLTEFATTMQRVAGRPR